MSNTEGGGINTGIIKAILRKPTSHLLFWGTLLLLDFLLVSLMSLPKHGLLRNITNLSVWVIFFYASIELLF